MAAPAIASASRIKVPKAAIHRVLHSFVCLETRLIMEVDGGQHAEQTLYDAKRTAWLETKADSGIMKF